MLGPALLFALSGCSTMAYLGHTAKGQWQLMQAREPIDALINDDSTPPPLRARLQQVQAIRDFAVTELRLPDNDSYRSLSVTGRDAVTWTVSAAPTLAVEPVEWCFPIAGCVPYRGYFAENRARAFARKQQRKGLDVAVVPVLAYSTLGWFDDPVTDTMLGFDELALANLLFHELAHQQVYVAGDTAFNESYATWVGRKGVRRWIKQSDGHERLLQAWIARLQAQRQFTERAESTRSALRQLYASDQSATLKLAGKAALLEELGRHLSAEDRTRLGIHDEDGRVPLNNAHLALFATYSDWLCAFDELWRQSGSDFAAFHRLAAEVGELDTEQRTAVLARACQR